MLRRLTLLAALAAVSVTGLGCGSPWAERPLASIDASTTNLGGEYARFTLRDERVIELRLLRVEYPYVWGNRRIHGQVARAQMQIDLREVARVDVGQ
jgi:hypothetical protein